jgi:hypothetical protein
VIVASGRADLGDVDLFAVVWVVVVRVIGVLVRLVWLVCLDPFLFLMSGKSD